MRFEGAEFCTLALLFLVCAPFWFFRGRRRQKWPTQQHPSMFKDYRR